MQESISRLVANIVSKSKTDDIFVIGKGPSVDAIDLHGLQDGLIINLNDSERIVPGHVGLFSANWVRHSLQEEGFRCGFYLAGKPLPPEVPHVVLPPIPLDLDREDLSLFRVQDGTFYDESFLLLNAIKLALAVSREKGRPQNLYLLGFDFSTVGGSFSRRIEVDHSGTTQTDRQAIIVAQEYEFRQFLNFFKQGGLLNLFHVGNREFSAFNPVGFNVRFSGKTPKPVTPVDVARPDRVLIVAEFTNNHLGDTARMLEMVERAKGAGADLVKVQKRDVDTFYTPEQLASYYWSPFGNTLGDYRRGVELDAEKLHLLDEACRKLDIPWFCSVLDYPSYEVIRGFNPSLLKIPSTISNHRKFHQQLAADYRGGLVVSTGFTDEHYPRYVLDTFKDNAFIYLLHCISAYPAPRSACNLAVVKMYQELAEKDPRIIPGYSSHDLGSTGCLLAVAAGARMLEKHVKLGNVEWVHFDKVAIDLATGDFDRFVQDVRRAEEILGSPQKTVLDCEYHKYEVHEAKDTP